MTQVRSELSTRLGVFVKCWHDAWEAARRPVLLLPILPLLLAGAVWLLLLSTFPRPPLDALLVPAWRIAGGDLALHYPDALALLPRIAGWGAPLVTLLVGVPGFALVVAVLPGVFHGDRPRGSLARAARSRIPAAWIVSLPAAIISAMSLVAADAAKGPAVSPTDALARDLFGLAFLAVGLVAQALFTYALPAVVIGGLRPAAAVLRSFSLSSRYLGITLGLVVGAALLAFPLRIAGANLRELFEIATPEISFVFCVFGLVGSALGSWFLTVTTTRLYLHRHGVNR